MLISQEHLARRFDSAQQIAGRAEETMHEIAQPLTILQGCLELALAADSIENYRSACRMALEQVQRISERVRSASAMVQGGAAVFARRQSEAEGLGQ